MFGKLFKHDMKAMFRWFILLYVCLLGVTAWGVFSVYLSAFFSEKAWESSSAFSAVPYSCCLLSIVFCCFVLGVALLVGEIIVFARFYKNLMSDEGYLTFTLPTTPGKILLSKYLSAFLYLAISSALSLFGILLIGVLLCRSTFPVDFISLMKTLLDNVVKPYVGLLLILFLLGISYSITLIYLSVVVGGVAAKKHKLLAGIGFYVLFSYGLQLIGNIASSLIPIFGNIWIESSGDSLTDLSFSGISYGILIFYILLLALLSVLFLLISRWLLNKKLNLN